MQTQPLQGCAPSSNSGLWLTFLTLSGLYHTGDTYLGFSPFQMILSFFFKSHFIQLENHKQGKLKLSRSLIVFSSNLSHLPPPLPPPFFNFSDNLFKHIFPGTYSDYIPYKPRINWSWKFLKATFLWFQQSYSKLWWWAKHPLIHFGEREDILVLRLVIYCCTTNNFKT